MLIPYQLEHVLPLLPAIGSLLLAGVPGWTPVGEDALSPAETRYPMEGLYPRGFSTSLRRMDGDHREEGFIRVELGGKKKRGVRSLRTIIVTDICEPPSRVLDYGPLQELYVMLTVQPSL